MANSLQALEIHKMSGYWRAKGFTRMGIDEVLERCDCTITYKRKQWQHFCKLKNELTIKEPTLIGLLRKII